MITNIIIAWSNFWKIFNESCGKITHYANYLPKSSAIMKTILGWDASILAIKYPLRTKVSIDSPIHIFAFRYCLVFRYQCIEINYCCCLYTRWNSLSKRTHNQFLWTFTKREFDRVERWITIRRIICSDSVQIWDSQSLHTLRRSYMYRYI